MLNATSNQAFTQSNVLVTRDVRFAIGSPVSTLQHVKDEAVLLSVHYSGTSHRTCCLPSPFCESAGQSHSSAARAAASNP